MLEWKWINEKLYGLVLPTTLKVGNGGDPDKTKAWLTPADVQPFKLSLMYSVQPVENRDGVPLKKNLDAWLAEHSGDRRKALGLTSLAAHRQWCCYGKFCDQFEVTAKVVQADFEKGLRGGKLTGTALETAIAKRMPPLVRMLDMLSVHMKVIAVPISHRLIELELAIPKSSSRTRKIC